MNVLEQFKEINEYYSPKVIGEINDVYVKIALAKGNDIPWHNHANEDEMFYILEGELKMEIENQPDVILRSGDMYIVKKGVNHRVSAEKECKIMLIENKTTAHTGDVITDVTRTIQDQLNR